MRYLPPIFLFSFVIATFSVAASVQPIPNYPRPVTSFWAIRSVDTMKYSRDMARQTLKDPEFDAVIDRQVHAIAETGANYVAIATPYDEEFVPVTKRWVAAARRYDLSVWFRGNFSGWEGWFEYKKIDQIQHLRMTRAFILNHPDLFADGDIFVACPECENGGPGDPRFNGQLERHRDFLRSLDVTAKQAFSQIKKKVATNYYSMNGDVARLTMDVKTTNDLGDIVAIDHYVESPRQLVRDVNYIAAQSEGKIVLGEFGAPIPDIHGKFNAAQQAQWIDSALSELTASPFLIGLNYWVGTGGSTALWNDDGNPYAGVSALTKFYKPQSLFGVITDELGKPVSGATVETNYRRVTTDSKGYYQLPYIPDKNFMLQVTAPGYWARRITLVNQQNQLNVTMKSFRISLGTSIQSLINAVTNILP